MNAESAGNCDKLCGSTPGAFGKKIPPFSIELGGFHPISSVLSIPFLNEAGAPFPIPTVFELLAIF
jgi:hypothetical protein